MGLGIVPCRRTGSIQLILHSIVLVHILIELNTIIMNLSDLLHRAQLKPAIHLGGGSWAVSVACWKGAMAVHASWGVSAVRPRWSLMSMSLLSTVGANWAVLAACSAAIALASWIVVGKRGPFHNESGLLTVIEESKLLYWLKKRDNPGHPASGEVWAMPGGPATDWFLSSLGLGLSRNQTGCIHAGSTNCLI